MKIKKYIILKTVFLAMVSVAFFFACKDEEKDLLLPRLFSPVLTKDLIAKENTITVNISKLNGTQSYTIYVSSDTFKTIDRTIETDTSAVVITNLLWNIDYQLLAKAHASDSTHDSKISTLGAIKTEKFPSILKPPAVTDVTDVAARVSWNTDGAPVTSVKVYKKVGYKNNANIFLSEIAITPSEVTAAEKIVPGLKASTKYVIYLMSGDSIRGWEDYKTQPSFVAPPGSTVVDLRGIAKVSILADTILDVNSGSIIILEKGRKYDILSLTALTKSVTLQAGLDFNPNPPKVFLSSNLTFASGSTVDSVVFKDITLFSDSYGGKYIFNISNACTVGKVKFQSCKMEIFRGLFRTQTAVAANITNYVINNCIIDSISNYGVITVDNIANKVSNISIKNSTIYKVERIIVSKQSSSSVNIENCTINQAPSTNGYLIDYGANTVSSPITVNNCILGPGKFNGASAIVINGVRVNASTTVSSYNTYVTAEYTASNLTSTTKIPDIMSYSGTSLVLYKNPKAGDFTIIDNGFVGKSTTGDPRWRK